MSFPITMTWLAKCQQRTQRPTRHFDSMPLSLSLCQLIRCSTQFVFISCELKKSSKIVTVGRCKLFGEVTIPMEIPLVCTEVATKPFAISVEHAKSRQIQKHDTEVPCIVFFSMIITFYCQFHSNRFDGHDFNRFGISVEYFQFTFKGGGGSNICPSIFAILRAQTTKFPSQSCCSLVN